MLRWWQHKQLDGDLGRKATKSRPSVDQTSDFFLSLKYLQGTHQGSQRHGCGVEWVLGVGGCYDNGAGRGCLGDGCH